MTVAQKTTFLKPADREGQYSPRWFVLDAEGMVVGRIATQIATVLMGKHKPEYTPHVNTGDYVIVVNADKVKFVGDNVVHAENKYFSTKMDKKSYYRHSSYPGGLKQIPAIRMWEQKPTEILLLAVRRMLPKNAMARYRMDMLKLYAGPEHPHQAQQPQPFPEHLLPR